MPTVKAIHISKSLKSQPHEPKLVNKYVFATTEGNKARAYNNVYKSLGVW